MGSGGENGWLQRKKHRHRSLFLPAEIFVFGLAGARQTRQIGGKFGKLMMNQGGNADAPAVPAAAAITNWLGIEAATQRNAT